MLVRGSETSWDISYAAATSGGVGARGIRWEGARLAAFDSVLYSEGIFLKGVSGGSLAYEAGLWEDL